eukprot:NODE_20604_length_790_cov_8.129713.p1 GENE.NODE_20604_length_790_cov_8.129713~~NODE_20604_length_790_cov_8.129713.p1  ORF type:complete len:208 (+),score=40.08 NODE_20604_length_790_cov_8.129713:84-707(+)
MWALIDRPAANAEVARTPPPAMPGPSLPQYEVERAQQLERLDAQARAWATRAAEREGAVEHGEDTRCLDKHLEHSHAHLERTHAAMVAKQQARELRAELGVLDISMFEARSSALRQEQLRADQQRIEDHLAQLRRRQAAAEATGHRRWLRCATHDMTGPRSLLASPGLGLGLKCGQSCPHVQARQCSRMSGQLNSRDCITPHRVPPC